MARLVQRVDHRPRTGLDDVGGGAVRAEGAAVDPHLQEDLAHAVAARGDRAEAEALHLDGLADDLADGREGSRDRAVAGAGGVARAGVRPGERHIGRGRAAAAHHAQLAQLELLGRIVEALVQQCQQVLVQDLALALGELQERLVDAAQLLVLEVVAQLLEAARQRVPPRMAAQHQRGPGNAHGVGLDDLVGQAVLEHAVLVDARLVRERVASHDRLVGLGEGAGQVGEHLARAVELARLDAGVEGVLRGAHAARHDDFLQRGVARPLADAVDGALHLPRARADGGERVRDGQAQVVVAVRAQNHAGRRGHPAAHLPEHGAVLLGRRVADGVGQVDGGGALADRDLHALAQEVEPGAARILGAPFHVVGEALRPPHALADPLHSLLAGHPQLGLEVQVGGGQEDVDAAAGGPPDRLARQVDVPVGAAREGGDDRPPDLGRDLLHAPEVRFGGRGEAGLDHVHPEHLELPGEPHLLLDGEAVAGRLFSVPECRVENDDPACHAMLSLVRKTKAPRTRWSAAPLLVSASPAIDSSARYRHAAEPAPSNKKDRKDTKEDQKQAVEIHVVRCCDSGSWNRRAPRRLHKNTHAPDWEGTQAAGRLSSG